MICQNKNFTTSQAHQMRFSLSSFAKNTNQLLPILPKILLKKVSWRHFNDGLWYDSLWRFYKSTRAALPINLTEKSCAPVILRQSLCYNACNAPKNCEKTCAKL
ncbi:hypothetical protein B0181_10945, partial [Moraxella caviae]